MAAAMTGFSQPPDPDHDPVAAEAEAAEPMTPDEHQHPTEADLDEADAERAETGSEQPDAK